MSDKSFHEIQYGNSLENKFVVLVSVVVESNRITIVFVNAGSSNNRAAKISANVFSNDGRIAEVWFCIDIEPILLIAVNRSFDFFEGITNQCLHFIEECSLKRFPEKLIIKVFEGTPTPGITNTAFRNETVDMGIPFEVPSKGMEDADKAGSEAF